MLHSRTRTHATSGTKRCIKDRLTLLAVCPVRAKNGLLNRFPYALTSLQPAGIGQLLEQGLSYCSRTRTYATSVTKRCIKNRLTLLAVCPVKAKNNYQLFSIRTHQFTASGHWSVTRARLILLLEDSNLRHFGDKKMHQGQIVSFGSLSRSC